MKKHNYVFFFLWLSVSVIAYSQSSEVKPFAPELFLPELSGAVCGFSRDGNTIYFVREDTVADKLFIYEAHRKGKKWVDIKLLSFSGLHNDLGGRLTPNGEIFYFTSDRPGGTARQGDQWNIWVSNFVNGNWSEAQPLAAVNNKGNECCPVPLAEGSLIFSSDRGKLQEWWIYSWDGSTENLLHNLTDTAAWQWPSTYVDSEQLMLMNSMKRKDSMGKDDVYVSFYRNNQWTTPINVGTPINTSQYEDGAILSPDKKYLIFNRHETGATPSQVMYTPWTPIIKRLKE